MKNFIFIYGVQKNIHYNIEKMSNSHKRDYAPGKTKGTGKLGSFCQGFTESDCVKAKSACNWIKAKNPYCARRTDSKANMNALSKFNDNKTISNAKEIAEITIAFSMYHKNGEMMTEQEIYDDILSRDHHFQWVVSHFLEDYGVNEDGYDYDDIHTEVVDNFILVKINIAAVSDLSLDVNDTIRQLQRDFNKKTMKGPIALDEEKNTYIKSITVVSQEDINKKEFGFTSKKKTDQGPLRIDRFSVKRAQKAHKEMMERLARGEEL